MAGGHLGGARHCRAAGGGREAGRACARGARRGQCESKPRSVGGLRLHWPHHCCYGEPPPAGLPASREAACGGSCPCGPALSAASPGDFRSVACAGGCCRGMQAWRRDRCGPSHCALACWEVSLGRCRAPGIALSRRPCAGGQPQGNSGRRQRRASPAGCLGRQIVVHVGVVTDHLGVRKVIAGILRPRGGAGPVRRRRTCG